MGVAVLAVAAPAATASYNLARLLGGDAELMASAVAATTLGALVTLPSIWSLPFQSRVPVVMQQHCRAWLITTQSA